MKIADLWQKLKEIFKIRGRLILFYASLFFIIFLVGIGSGYLIFNKNGNVEPQITDPYIAFISEIYDTVKTNYWEKVTDENLSNVFELGAEKITVKPQVLESKNKLGVEKMVTGIIKEMPEEKKKEFIVALGNIVLVNLQPFGRSQLYSIKDETGLKNNLQNIDTGTDLYSVLGVDKNASSEKISSAYNEKIAELATEENQPDYSEKLSQLERAKDALINETAKNAYDATKAEPTVVGELISPSVLHLKIKRISPTVLSELKQVTDNFDKGEALDSLIIDLRSNIGGSMDILPYLLGPFIGPNQYALELLHQGEYTPIKTLSGWLPGLVRYKKVVVLIDGQDQSSAEVVASALKRYNVGVVVGSKTKGWGTVERVFDLETQIDKNEKYSVYLVHSLTIGDDGQPIEGNGVAPVIDISNNNWENQLTPYFNDPELVKAVRNIISK
ncbi:MAG: S41 family peptidase [bacterium]